MIEKQKDGSIFITSDSPICEYCTRKHYPDEEFDDSLKCSNCKHRGFGLYDSCTDYDDNFLGIQCVTTDPKDA